MPDNCNVNDVKRVASLDPREAISIVGGNNIEVIKSSTPEKDTYTINYKAYSAPRIEVTTLIKKVGVVVPSVTFNAEIFKGSVDILSRTMTPDKELDLEMPFSWIEMNVVGTDVGFWPKYSGQPTTISVTDVTGNTVTRQVGVEYRNLFYMGYSTSDTLNESEIKTLIEQGLFTSIKSKYASYVYNYSVVPTYIYWAYPLGTPEIITASEGPLPVPLKLDLPNVTITDEGISKSYRVVRTAVKTKFVNSTILLT